MLIRLPLALAAFALLPLSASAGDAQTPAQVCADDGWKAVFPAAGAVCLATRHGLVIASPSEAASLLSVIDEAAVRFDRHFGSPRSTIAVVPGGSLSAAQIAWLGERGQRGFPWLSGEQRRALIAPRIRARIQEQRPEITGDALDMVVERAMASVLGQDSGTERGALAHELGHLWFHATFEGSAETTSEGGTLRYGSSAPDWIDEMAAVLAENDELTASRRAGLADLAAGSGDAGLYPLAEYLTMPHPVMTAPNREQIVGQPGSDGGSRVQIVGRGDGDAMAGRRTMLRFYTQSRGFADYLIEETGDPRVFLSIARALSGGERFDQWLAREGAARHLPTSVDALARDWEAWTRGR